MSIKGFNVNGVTEQYDYNSLDNKPEIHSIPTGGTAGQVLAKRSGADYAVEWADQTGGGGDITVDDVLSNTSENPVQNKVITAALATKADQAGIQQVIENEVDDWLSVQAPSIGTLSYAAKQALLACFRHVAWIDDQGQSYYNALESELFPDATLESITAVFTQGSAVIYDTDSLDTIKQYLVVTANFSDSTTETVTIYTLSGTLTAGTSTITVSYGGKTDTFDVTVTRLEIKVFRGKGSNGASIIDNAKRALSEPVAFTNVAPITIEWPSLSAFRAGFKNTTTDINTLDTSALNIVPIAYLNEPAPSTAFDAWLTRTGEEFLTDKYGTGVVLTPMTFSQSSGYVRLLFADITSISNPLPSKSINSVFYINGIPYHLVETPVSEFE